MEVCGPAEPITFLPGSFERGKRGVTLRYLPSLMPADGGGGEALPIGANSGDFFLRRVCERELSSQT